MIPPALIYAGAVLKRIKRNAANIQYLTQDRFLALIHSLGPFVQDDPDPFVLECLAGYDEEQAIKVCQELKRQIIKADGGSLKSIRDLLQ